MGFLDSLLGEGSKADVKRKEEEFKAAEAGKRVPDIPFRVSTSFLPLRLSATKQNSVNLIVKLTNITNDPQLVSVDVMLGRKDLIGFDPMCINKATEKKVGQVGAGETKEVSIPIFASNQTGAGDYNLDISVYAHYQDYNKVYASVAKKTNLRVV
jgi:hypothetical protein